MHWVLGPQGDGVQGLDGKRHGVVGGSPSYSERQKHIASPWTTLHPEYGPHGFGEHSSPSGTKKKKTRFYSNVVEQIEIILLIIN